MKNKIIIILKKISSIGNITLKIISSIGPMFLIYLFFGLAYLFKRTPKGAYCTLYLPYVIFLVMSFSPKTLKLRKYVLIPYSIWFFVVFGISRGSIVALLMLLLVYLVFIDNISFLSKIGRKK